MDKHSAIRLGAGLVIFLLIVGHSTGLWHSVLLERLENMAYDTRIAMTLPELPEQPIVIVDINDASLAEEGQWPWGRDRLALLVDHLFDTYDARLLGIDVVFAERDESAGLRALEAMARDDPVLAERLREIRPALDGDRHLAAAIERHPVILGYYFEGGDPDAVEPPVGTLPAPVPLRLPEGFDDGELALPQAARYGANLALLQNNAAGAGFFDNPLVDSDGVYRRVPMLQRYGDSYYESLSLAMARALLGQPPVELVMPGGRYRNLEELRIRDQRIPVDAQGAALVSYHGGQGTFPYVSAADVIHQRADPAVLDDAIVLLGASAPGLLDLRTTPLQNVFPGVEIHANLLAGMLAQEIRHRPAYTLGAEVILLTLIFLVMSLLLATLPALWMAGLSAALAGVTVLGNLYAWSFGHWVLPLATPLALIVLLFVLHSAYGYFVEARGKRAIKHLFGQYVPPELVDEMSRADHPDAFALEGESRDMTVLFSDVRDFTALSETMSAHELTQLMNAYLTPMTAAIHRHRGTIDKYIGDAIMAFWGAPMTDADHATHAVDAALEMQRRLQQLNQAFTARGWPALRIGAGINSGEMNVGNMGSAFRMAYTVMGDAVNLGSRLEALTRHYEHDILVSENTVNAAPQHVFREVDLVRVRGKDQPVTVFEPLGRRAELDAQVLEDIEHYHRAIKRFRQQRWELAEKALLKLREQDPAQPLYTMYLERIGNYRLHPPGDDWDGVYAQ